MELSGRSITETINQLKVLQEGLNDATKHIVEDFAEAGKEYLLQNYDTTKDIPIDDDWVVETNINGNKGRVYSRGKSVIYMEFGTGDIGRDSEQNPKRYDFPLNDFNTGKTIKEDEQGHYWIHKHEVQRGIPAGCQVYNASQTLKKNAISAAKQIVRDDLRLR